MDVPLDGYAFDLETLELTNDNLEWRSSLDGFLGQGPSLLLPAQSLSEGEHQITFSATDTAGYSERAQVTIRVERLPPPRLSIERQGGQVRIGWLGLVEYRLESTPTPADASSWTRLEAALETVDGETSYTVPITSQRMFYRLVRP